MHFPFIYILAMCFSIKDQQGKAAFNERNPHMTQQQEPTARSPGGPRTKTGQGKDRARTGVHLDEISKKTPNVNIDQFSNAVNDLLRELDEKYSMTESIQNARQKMQEPRFKTWDNDRKSAGMLINLYTNSDENKHLPDAVFYRSLNEAIRSENPDFIWQKSKKLLNEALHKIGHETFEYTFRGEKCCNSSIPENQTEGSTVLVRGFWSTTLHPSHTDHFGGAEYAFIIIENVQGVNVQHVSVTAKEKEVLLQSPRKYILKRKISNKEEQRKELKSLQYPDFDPSKFDPKNIFILVPLNENPKHDEVPLNENRKHDEVPLNENREHDEVPLNENRRHDEVPLNENRKHDEVPLDENREHDEVPLNENRKHDEVPLNENRKHDEVPLNENREHDEVPLNENRKHDEVPLNENRKHDEDEVSKKTPNVNIDQFSNAVNDLFQELDKKYSMTESTGNARKKMQEPRFKTWEDDLKSAGMLINLYTNSDEYKHLPNATFYRSLNEAIRSENPDFIWQKSEKLLNEALHKIGHETFEYTFRGEKCCNSSIPENQTEGSTVLVRGFWSTTLHPSHTDHFGGAEYAFIIIENVQGVNVQHVSVTAKEKEVLLQSPRKYILKRKISNKEEQRKELKSLQYPDFDPSKFDPKNIFILVPLNENPKHDEVPLNENRKHDEVPLNENREHDEVPLNENRRHDEVPLNENRKHDEVPLNENREHDEVPLNENRKHDEVPLNENRKHDEVPLNENREHDEVPLNENRKHDEVPLNENRKHDEDEVSKKTPNVNIDQFSNAVNDLFQELDKKYSMTESTGNARKKMQEPRFKTWEDDLKSAGMLINLYTNSDEYKHLPNATFYRSLNEAIRSENPDFIWQKSEKLLNEALHKIGHETFEYTFRGEKDGGSSIPENLTEGSTLTVRGFWSTTLHPSHTDHFGGAEYAFIIIENVQGVNVQHVSVTDMEKEVLLQSSRKYILKRKISNKEEQRKELESLQYPDFDPSKFDPKNIFILVPLNENRKHDGVPLNENRKHDEVPLNENREHDEVPLNENRKHDEVPLNENRKHDEVPLNENREHDEVPLNENRKHDEVPLNENRKHDEVPLNENRKHDEVPLNENCEHDEFPLNENRKHDEVPLNENRKHDEVPLNENRKHDEVPLNENREHDEL
ncbi:uncharacterized protein LOC132730561 isoform X2 [Ruditapes philippinarum]|uniref:uncharacterized protein LOC132730561 isoform X2 n=1 Tax=Ruditapes philippinarum TaxID=129788 RepID=UPI00295B38C7|nr:uncharacterized protein LOC132730561 isoform X2 [Ruditapes philippinarum]